MARPPRPPLPQPQEPKKDRSAAQKKFAVLACYVIALIGFVASIIYFVTGHPNEGGPLLIVPVAAIVLSTLVPKGWRG